MTNESAVKALQASLTARLTREGVHVGTTAGYPRIEVGEVVENTPLDKAGTVRSLSVVITTITTDSEVRAVDLNNESLHRLSELPPDPSPYGYNLVGHVFTRLQKRQEQSDTQNVLYIVEQSLDYFLAKIEETKEEEGEGGGNEAPEGQSDAPPTEQEENN